MNCNLHYNVGDIGNGGGYASVGEGGIREISVPSTQIWCEPKTTLKHKAYFKKQKPYASINNSTDSQAQINIKRFSLIGRFVHIDIRKLHRCRANFQFVRVSP